MTTCLVEMRANGAAVAMTMPSAHTYSRPGQVEVPQWHKDILDQRVLTLSEGRAVVLEWQDAQKQIEQATR
jgi:hypothetical protein